MFGCRRSNTDELLRIMLKKYRLHILQWPNDGIFPGQVVIEKSNGQTLCAPQSTIFVSNAVLHVRKRSSMADIEETFSGKLEANGGLGILDNLAAAFGGTTGKLRTAYEKATKVVLRVRMSQWLDCDPSELSSFVAKAELRPDQGLFRDGDKLYVINGVATAKELEIIAYDSGDSELAVDAQAIHAGSADAKLKARREGGASVVYGGANPVAFGVELLQLEVRNGSWAIDGVDQYVQLRGEEDFPASATAFIGDAEDGPAFVGLRVWQG